MPIALSELRISCETPAGTVGGDVFGGRFMDCGAGLDFSGHIGLCNNREKIHPVGAPNTPNNYFGRK